MLCEAEAFARAVYFQEYVGNALLVVHTTNGEALNTARRAHGKGLPLYVETGPHYLTLFDDLYKGENGHLAICSPPLRTPKEAEELWEGLKDGTILLTGSDDCTFDVDEKSLFLEKNPDGTWKRFGRRWDSMIPFRCGMSDGLAAQLPEISASHTAMKASASVRCCPTG